MNLTFDDVLNWWRSQKLETVADYMQVLNNFRVLFACNSNAIEGSTVEYHTTREIFEDGKVSSFTGDMRGIMEVINQKFAFEFIVKALIERKPMDMHFIKKVHKLLLYGCYDERRWSKGERPGQFKKGDYCVGVDSEGSIPQDVVPDLKYLLEEIADFEGVKPLVSAVYFHLRFEQIHPFADGNGRVGRTLMNYYLMLHGYPPVVLFNEDKETYYMALTVWDKSGEMSGFLEFFKEQAIKTWEPIIVKGTSDAKPTALSELMKMEDEVKE